MDANKKWQTENSKALLHVLVGKFPSPYSVQNKHQCVHRLSISPPHTHLLPQGFQFFPFWFFFFSTLSRGLWLRIEPAIIKEDSPYKRKECLHKCKMSPHKQEKRPHKWAEVVYRKRTNRAEQCRWDLDFSKIWIPILATRKFFNFFLPSFRIRTRGWLSDTNC